MTNLIDALHIPDTQSARDDRQLAIQRVGIRAVRYPLQLRIEGAVVPTVAEWALDVALPAEQKGTHMSRFVAWLDAIDAPLDIATLRAEAGADAGLARCRRRPHRGFVPVLPEKACAGVRRREPARVPGPADRRGEVRCDYGLARGRRSGQVALPVLEGNLRLRRAQPALARDDPGRGAWPSCRGASWCALPKTRRRPRSGRRSSAPTRNGSPSAPTKIPSSSRTWCATSRCCSTPMPRIGRYCVDVENFESIHAHSAVARIER